MHPVTSTKNRKLGICCCNIGDESNYVNPGTDFYEVYDTAKWHPC